MSWIYEKKRKITGLNNNLKDVQMQQNSELKLCWTHLNPQKFNLTSPNSLRRWDPRSVSYHWHNVRRSCNSSGELGSNRQWPRQTRDGRHRLENSPCSHYTPNKTRFDNCQPFHLSRQKHGFFSNVGSYPIWRRILVFMYLCVWIEK